MYIENFKCNQLTIVNLYMKNVPYIMSYFLSVKTFK